MNRFRTRAVLAAVALAFVASLASPAQAGLFGDKDKKGNLKKKDKDSELRDGNADLQAELGPYKGVKHAVGVRDFENDAGWGAEFNLPKNLGIMLESALIDTGRFVIVERDKLDLVMDEQDLAASGRAAQAGEVAKTGVIRPAKFIGTGALVEVEYNESGVGGGFSISGVRIGGDHGKAQVTIIAKLVDSSTGGVVAKQRIVGKAGRTGLKFGLTHGKFDGDLGGFAKTPVAEAVQDCINQAAIFFAREMQAQPVEGAVVMVKDGRVIINRGSTHSLQPGAVWAVTEKGEDLIDPDTGEVLERAEGRQVATIRVDQVNEKVSYCTVLSGEANPARGSVVKLTSMPMASDTAPDAAAEPAAAAD